MRTSKEKARDETLANRVYAAAKKDFKRSMRGETDADMKKMYRNDRLDLIYLSSLIRRGHYIEGLRHYDSLDTAVQEIVPASAINALNKWG